MQTPLEAFMGWFDTTPRTVREALAHLFQVATTEDATAMTAPRARSLGEFRNWAVKRDFPLRIAARMFYVRSVFDMVIIHHNEILSDHGMFQKAGETDKILNISSRQWESVLETWRTLRQEELSDSYIHSWASWMIKMQMENA